jgi:hypothetical protein
MFDLIEYLCDDYYDRSWYIHQWLIQNVGLIRSHDDDTIYGDGWQMTESWDGDYLYEVTLSIDNHDFVILFSMTFL